ncbi:hypothetical protein IJD15_04320 [bacterium]|nr:hypothetical protein [bacterium]
MNKILNRKKHTPINTYNEDILDLDLFIDGIQTEILQAFSSKDNYTIGIVSNWGDGKSSVVNLLIEKLLKKSKLLKGQIFSHIILFASALVLPSIWIFFNWQNIIKFFTINLILILGVIALFLFVFHRKIYDISLFIWDKIVKIFYKKDIVIIRFSPWSLSNINQIYTEYLSSLAKNLDSSSSLFPSLLLLYTETLLQKDLSFLKKYIKTEKSIEELKDEISNLLIKTSRKIIVIIDDVDRINGIEIYNLFKLIGSVANFPNIVNIIAYDKHYVCTELNNYLNKEENSISNANQYLKKIINKEFMLPKISNAKLYEIFASELKSIIGATNLNVYNEQELKYNYINTIGFYIQNIRDLKLLLNAFEFHYSIFKIRGININIIDLLLVTTLRVFKYELWLELYEYKQKQDYNIGGINFITNSNNDEINFPDFANLEFENKNIIATLIKPEYRGCSPINDRYKYDIKRFGVNLETTNLYFEFNPPYSNIENIIKAIISEKIDMQIFEKDTSEDVYSSDFYDLLFSRQYEHLWTAKTIFNLIEICLFCNIKIKFPKYNFIFFFERDKHYMNGISVENFTNYLLELSLLKNIDINMFIYIIHGYFIYSSSNSHHENDIPINEVPYFHKLSDFIISRLLICKIDLFEFDNIIHLLTRFSKYDKEYQSLILCKFEQQIKDIDNDELLNFIMKYKEISNTSNGDEIYFDSFMKYICKNEIREILKNKLLSIQKNEEIIKNNNYVDTYKYGLSGEHKETHLVEYLLDFYFKEVNIK